MVCQSTALLALSWLALGSATDGPASHLVLDASAKDFSASCGRAAFYPDERSRGPSRASQDPVAICGFIAALYSPPHDDTDLAIVWTDLYSI